MQIRWRLVACWLQVTVLALLPWIASWRVSWVPLCVAVMLLLRPACHPALSIMPWTWVPAGASAVVFLLLFAGPRTTGVWLVLAACVGVLQWGFRRRVAGVPSLGVCMGLLTFSGAFLVNPRLLELAHGSWAAPGVLLYSAFRLAQRAGGPLAGRRPGLTSPSRLVRGTLTMDEVVLGDSQGLPRSAVLNLELRAGESVAIICDTPQEVEALALLCAGRRPACRGVVAIDGVPLLQSDSLVAVIAVGEPFVPGDLEDNLVALCEDDVEPARLMAVIEACSLSDVAEQLEEGELDEDGGPLQPLERLLLQAGRVLLSEYRVVLVVDPMVWVNAVRGEMWRASVVRASVGRSAIWITPDRALAQRADTVLEFKHGTLRRADHQKRG